MKPKIILCLMLSAFLASCSNPTTSDTKTTAIAPVISIENPRIRTPLGQNPNTGGYMVIKNTGSEADTLVSVNCDCAGAVEIHEMKHEAGMMKMQPLTEGLTIPAGGEVALSPGGIHLMIMAIKPEMRNDPKFELELQFAKAKSVIIEAELTDKP